MRKQKELSPKQQNNILSMLSIGCSRTAAMRCVQCSPSVFRQTMLAHPSFTEQVLKAEEGSEIFCLSHLRKAAQKEQHWRAAAWLLERRLPDRYGIKKAAVLTPNKMRQLILSCMQIITEELPDKKLQAKIFSKLAEQMDND